MALQKTFSHRGVTAPNGHIRVRYINVTTAAANAEVEFSANANELPLRVQTYKFVPDFTDTGVNIFKQAYQHLKSRPELAGAVDV